MQERNEKYRNCILNSAVDMVDNLDQDNGIRRYFSTKEQETMFMEDEANVEFTEMCAARYV